MDTQNEDLTKQQDQIKKMILEGQRKVQAVTSKYTSYMADNKKIAEELEEIVNKLKECMGGLDEIEKSYKESKEQQLKLKEQFATKVQSSSDQADQIKQQRDEEAEKNKAQAEAALAQQQEENEAKAQRDKEESEAAQKVIEEDNEKEKKRLAQEHAESKRVAKEKAILAAQESKNALDQATAKGVADVAAAHEIDEQAKKKVEELLAAQRVEFDTALTEQKEGFEREAVDAAKRADEALAQEKQHSLEEKQQKEEAYQAAETKSKAANDAQQEKVKATLETTKSAELEEAEKRCQEQRQQLVEQITAGMTDFDKLADLNFEGQQARVDEFKKIVDESCAKVDQVLSQIPKDGGVEEEKSGDGAPGLPPPALEPDSSSRGRSTGLVANSEWSGSRMRAERKAAEKSATARKKDVSTIPPLDDDAVPSWAKASTPDALAWLTKHNSFAYHFCVFKGFNTKQLCNKRKIDEYMAELEKYTVTINREPTSKMEYRDACKDAYKKFYFRIEELKKQGEWPKEGVTHLQPQQELKLLMGFWFVNYCDQRIDKDKPFGAQEFDDMKIMEMVNSGFDAYYTRLESAGMPYLENLKQAASHGRTSSRSRSRSHSLGRKRQGGGFRYGMKIPKRRTLRSKMKTQHLKSKKKGYKKKKRGSRKRRRRRKTEKK
ncbi:MAG: hypothetical protein CXT73_04925 [Methanobacteriota archaeon]|nr:MAG: hypothetical protein CXT73_04925 [Euryarchaeota archaeon]